jgi:hypothetical protein
MRSTYNNDDTWMPWQPDDNAWPDYIPATPAQVAYAKAKPDHPSEVQHGS